MEKEYTEILKENFDKIAEYIKQKYPHAIKLSYDNDIKCVSPHHEYYTSYIVLSNGDVQYHYGSHGQPQNDRIYSYNQRGWVSNGYTHIEDILNEHIPDNNRTKGAIVSDRRLENLILEWDLQKMYIDGTLGRYEKIFNFKV